MEVLPMNIRWLHRSPKSESVRTPESPLDLHRVTSDFCFAICRFTLDCTCGAHFDTPFIDEALEWHEMHERLAPLADQLPVTT